MKLRFGEYELDEPRFELRRGGQVVAVQPKVLDLIVYLAKHRDRVVTKDELLETVWQGVVVTEASLSQAVSLARRAVGDSSDSQRVLRTVRGKGFQFVAPAEELGGAAAAARPAVMGESRLPLSEIPMTAPAVTPRRQLADTSTAARIDTATDEARAPRSQADEAMLFVVFHADEPTLGGAAYPLVGVDEVVIGRGTTRAAKRVSGKITEELVLTLPGSMLSRRHARLVRVRNTWFVVDDQSRNGTYVGGERIAREELSHGEVVECGRTLLCTGQVGIVVEELRDADSRQPPSGPLVSLLPRLRAVSDQLVRIALGDLSILIVGEAGTGKRLLARQLHRFSERPGPFEVVEIAARSEVALVRELFVGDGGRPGALQRAAEGTLLLDGVESLPASVQAQLAAELDARRRAPGPSTRIIATTATSLESRVRAGRYSSHLATLLSGFRCEMPRLVERRFDLGLLIASLLTELGAEDAVFEVDAARALFAHDWPGNVLELRQCLEAATTLARGTAITVEHLPSSVRR